MQTNQLSEEVRGEALNRLEDALYRGQVGRRDFMRIALAMGASAAGAEAVAADGSAAAEMQLYNTRNLQTAYDYIVIGCGSSGTVVASRLAAESNASVLVLEAGSTDQVPEVLNPMLWASNVGGLRDWAHVALPERALNGRAVALPMGKAVGGGSSINAMIWARGHKNDYDSWAEESGDAGWNYANILSIYKRIENWQGPDQDGLRGNGGRVWVELPKNPNPVNQAMLAGAASVGIPTFDDANGKMMEGPGGAAMCNLRVRDGRRRNVPSDYLHPVLKRGNITVLTGAEVQKLQLKGTKVTGVIFKRNGKVFTVTVSRRAILSAGAINTPKILMLSGIGDEAELRRHGIKVAAHVPGVGQNFQDHLLARSCIWEYQTPLPAANNAAESNFFWKSDSSLAGPDLQPVIVEAPFTSEITQKQFNPPAASWSLAPGLVRPKSRGRVTLTSSNPSDRALVDGAFLTHPDDMKALLRATEICRDIGNSAAMKEFVKREVMPGPLAKPAMEDFIRNAAFTYFHQSSTCKMGRDEMSVVDGRLSVRGIQNLSIADTSIMPTVTTGNTMAPAVIIGERMADILLAKA